MNKIIWTSIAWQLIMLTNIDFTRSFLHPPLVFKRISNFHTLYKTSPLYSATDNTVEEPINTNTYQQFNEIPNYEHRIPTNITHHRSGFVSIIGRPNMGKSTLLNALLNQTLCITTPRPQTTRHSILGIFSNDRTQLCFLDTPGVISKPGYQLQEEMNESVKQAFRDGDLILFVTQLDFPKEDTKKKKQEQDVDDEEEGQEMEDAILSSLQKTDKPILVLINKCDLLDTYPEAEQDLIYQTTIQKWREALPNAKCILPLSAETSHHNSGFAVLKAILLGQEDLPSLFRNLGKPRAGMFASSSKLWFEPEEVLDYIPSGPPLYDPNSLSDRSERFFCSEIIRKSIFQLFGKEVPYCCEVQIVGFQERSEKNPITRIRADIVVERDSQKGILVGKNGNMIKKVGMSSREQLQEFLEEEKVFLELSVRVDKNWRRNEDRLVEFGYAKKKKSKKKKKPKKE